LKPEIDFVMFQTGTAQGDRIFGLTFLFLIVALLVSWAYIEPLVWRLIVKISIRLSGIALQYDRQMRGEELSRARASSKVNSKINIKRRTGK
jgi:hypothetical protein